MGFGHNVLECRQIDFTQGPFAYPRVDAHAVGLLVVRREMLQRRAHSGALHPLDYAYGLMPGEIRVFTRIRTNGLRVGSF